MSEPANHFASLADAASPAAEAPPKAPSPPRFAGIGARIQGRPGESLDRMANRLHPVRK